MVPCGAPLGRELSALILLHTCWRTRSERSHRRIFLGEDQEEEEFQYNSGILNKSSIGPCGYDTSKLHVATDDGERHYGIRDPRNRGFAAKLMRLFRGAIGTRLVALQLTGFQASQLVLAQYGITTAAVPKACFEPLRAALQNEGMPFEEVKRRRPTLLKLLDHELPVSCSGTVGVTDKTEEGIRSAMMLRALRYGFWGLYEPETVQSASIISAQNLDPRRAARGDRRVRQIWHFAKNHLLQTTELLVRKEILSAKGRTEKRRLVRQMELVAKLEGMRDARLEHVELDAKGSCISAQKHEVANVIDALRTFESARFRATLFFRERHFQSLAHSAWHTLKHPIYSIRKFGTRWADEWARGTTGHKVAMILKPILKTATIAGLVLGVATMGTTSFPSLFVEHALGEAALAKTLFESSMLTFAVSKLIQQPVLDAVTDDVLAKGEANTMLQRFFASLDDEWAMSDTRARLQAEVERIMASNDTRVPLEKYEAEFAEHAGPDEDSGLEEEVRRIVSGMVYTGFVGEVSPLIQDLLVKAKSKEDRNYGWLRWPEWRRFRQGSDAYELLGRRLRLEGEKDWEARVVKVGSKVWCWGLCNRMITVEVFGLHAELELSADFKSQLMVFDPPAYHRAQPGWLLWHDWAEYRVSSDSRELVGKELHIDLELAGCSRWRDSCATTLDKGGHGALVMSASWKPFGQGYRRLTVLANLRTKCTLVLSPPLKACLRINDGLAFEKFTTDSPRREQEQRWASSNLSTVQDEVVKAMACAPHAQAKRSGRAGIGNVVLRKELGLPSVELQMEESGQVDTDSEEREVMDAVEEGFQSGSEHVCEQRSA